MSSKDPYLVAMEDTFADLDGWRLRGAKVEEPQRDSDLYVDDLVFSSMPMSQMARLSLLSASEHLRVVRDTLTARNLYPTAVHTVLRSALVGASQAVWMLHPDDGTVRQERGLILVEEVIRQSRVVLVEPGKTSPSPSEAAAIKEQVRFLDERLARVRSLRTSATQLNQTTLIGWALEHTFSDPALQDAGRIWWRRMSSDAHVLGWSLFQRSVVSQVDRRSGIATFNGSGTLEELANPYVACFRVLKHGWSLFDRRCEATA